MFKDFNTLLLPVSRTLVNSAANEFITTKKLKEALELFKIKDDTTAMWTSDRVVPKENRRKSELDAFSFLYAKIATLTKKVDDIARNHSVNAVQISTPVCEGCRENYKTRVYREYILLVKTTE
ncbi:Uncharacterized protein Adt_22402 [Abeliophyllum distichum]|uniref:Uncharacterized protein n=1 Tax=Abeliophyllum distichum TaxID=126358 RepID=A0ABD1T256_9LAMI